MGKKLTIDDVKIRLSEINPNIEILDDVYINNETKMECKCLIDGYKWGASWGNLSQGYGCPKCGRRLGANKKKLNLSDVKNRLYIINQNIQIIDDKYTDANTKLKCECLIDGHIWYPTWGSLSQGTGCPECGIRSRSDKQRFTIDDIKCKLKKINSDIEILSDKYVNTNHKLKCKCLIDDYEWATSFDKLSQGTGCPECAKRNNVGSYNYTIAKRNKDKWISEHAVLYLIKCFNKNEKFYKIGITKNSTNKRFASIKRMPYNYTILKEVHTNLHDAVYLENKLHALNKEFAYTPQIKFAGYTECFSNLHSFDIEAEMC